MLILKKTDFYTIAEKIYASLGNAHNIIQDKLHCQNPVEIDFKITYRHQEKTI